MDKKDYILGFNHGYILTKADSDLSTLLLNKIASEGDYVQGMKDGRKQFYKEIFPNKKTTQIYKEIILPDIKATQTPKKEEVKRNS